MSVSCKPLLQKYRAVLGAASVALSVCCVSTATAIAQSLPPATTLQNPEAGGNLVRFFSSKTPYEFWLTCLIGLFGLVVITVLVIALRRVRNARTEDIARPVIILTVIIGTLILVTVGYSNEQIAPAFGLFGTIIGYMLGRLSQPNPATSANPERQENVGADLQAINTPASHGLGQARQ
jgi:hypothetical protein